jgi:cytochrome c
MTAATAAILALVTLLGAAPARAVAKEPKTIWNGVFTEDQAKRGEQVYRQKCAFCHRDNLEGNSVDGGPPLRGPVFAGAWDKVTLAPLVKLVQELMPLEQPGSLTPQQTVDVVTFLLWANGAPFGSSELPLDAESHEAITFIQKRPSP